MYIWLIFPLSWREITYLLMLIYSIFFHFSKKQLNLFFKPEPLLAQIAIRFFFYRAPW